MRREGGKEVLYEKQYVHWKEEKIVEAKVKCGKMKRGKKSV